MTTPGRKRSATALPDSYKSVSPALTVDNATQLLVKAGVKWTRWLCTDGFRMPWNKMEELEVNITSNDDRLRCSVDHLLNTDPSPSYRRVISAVDYFAGQCSAASKMYEYAEPVTDPTLIPENVITVLKEIEDVDSLCRCLYVPENRRSDHSTIANHWVSYCVNATWQTLFSELYYLKQEAAMEIARRYLHVPSPDPSLTVDNMMKILECAEWDDVGYWLYVPDSERYRIKMQYSNDSSECSRACWSFWLHDFPTPSWAMVAEALFQCSCWTQDALKRLEQQYPTVISPARRQITCERAIKEKGSLEDTIVQGNCCGFPRAGKSSFKDRLVGRFRTTNTSTGVAEKVVRIEVSTSIVLAGEHSWEQLDNLEQEIAAVADKIIMSISKAETLLEMGNHPGIRSSEKKDKIQITAEQDTTSSVTPYEAIESSMSMPVSAVSTPEIDALYDNLHCEKRWTLYMSDVGGQLEFQELFPNMLFGPSVFFYTFRADQELNVSFRVEYLHSSGESMVPYEASVSTGESILQFLASVTSIGVLNKPDGSAVQPKVFFIATHIDKLESEQKITELDGELQKIVKQTQAFKDGMVVCNSKSCMLFPVNNLSEDETYFKRVRAAMHSIVTSSDDYHYTVPYTWSIFSFTIQHCPDQVIPYTTCFDIAKKCGIDTEEELDNCLWFLHHQIGILRHFHDISEFRDKVFKDVQFIFDKVTELIVHTFTFDKLLGNIFLHDEFIKKGIFSYSSLEKIYSATKYLSPSQLVKLLQHLRILAIIKEFKYFLPCSLVHADIRTEIESCPDWLPSLHYTFDSGYCPKGLFGALVANLLQTCQQDHKWKFKEDQIFRDQISFCVGPYLDRFQFTVTSSYISIEVFPSEAQDRRISLASVCYHVRQHISTNLVEVTKKLNYDPKRTPHRLAFQCPNKTCHAATHSAIIEFIDEESPSILECPYSPKPVSLPKNHQIWFDKTFQADIAQDISVKVAFEEVASASMDTVSPEKNLSLPPPTSQSACEDNKLLLVDDSNLDIDDLSEVYDTVEVVAAKWRLLSTKLHVKESRLDIIEKNHPNDVESCLLDALREWLRLNYDHKKHGKPSWKKLAKAVRKMDDGLFEKIVSEHRRGI